MSEKYDKTENRTDWTSSRRPRLHYIYYLLAIFDILTVTLGFVLLDRITSIHTAAIEDNLKWTHRLDGYDQLGVLAAAVDAPGNDIFTSMNVVQERQRFNAVLEKYNSKFNEIKKEISQDTSFDERIILLKSIETLENTMSRLVSEAELIFFYFSDGQSETAAMRMAEMDRLFAAVTGVLARLSMQTRNIQNAHLDKQLTVATSLRTFEYLIAGLIVVMVLGVTIYGHKLVQRFKQSSEDTNSHIQAQAQSEARLQAVLASALDPIVTIDQYGIINSVSDSIEQVIGYKVDELVGKNVSIIMPEPYRSLHDDYLDTYRETGSTNILGRTREFELLHRNGNHVPIELAVSRAEMPGSEQPIFTGIFHDITDRKQAEKELAEHRQHLEEIVTTRTSELEASHEQLRQADRLATIGTLAAGLGHDMNNVLLPIRARLDVMVGLDADEKMTKQFKAIRTSIDYLQQLTDGLHLLARDPDDTDPSTNATNLITWWKQMEPLLARGLPKNVKLKTEWADDLADVAVAPHRLTQAVLNLIVNAGEAIKGDGRVSVVAKMSSEGDFVQLTVEDNGEGMTPEVKRRALDPFYTTKKRGLGTGLGLSLVHGVVLSAGGTIRINSQSNEGTKVHLYFPTATTVSHADTMPHKDLSAFISISDPRIASLVSIFLDGASVHVQSGDSDGLDNCVLWVVDISSDKLRDADNYMSNSSGRVVVLGIKPDWWTNSDAVFVQEPDNFQELRKVIGEVVQLLKENKQ